MKRIGYLVISFSYLMKFNEFLVSFEHSRKKD